MSTITTGSLVRGLVDGLVGGLVIGPSITYVNGNPNNLLICPDVSGLAIDWPNGAIYINKIGSTWYKLGSTT